MNLKVLSQNTSGQTLRAQKWLSLDLISEENRKILTYGLTIIGGLLVMFLFVNARSENKRIISVLDSESGKNDD